MFSYYYDCLLKGREEGGGWKDKYFRDKSHTGTIPARRILFLNVYVFSFSYLQFVSQFAIIAANPHDKDKLNLRSAREKQMAWQGREVSEKRW